MTIEFSRSPYRFFLRTGILNDDDGMGGGCRFSPTTLATDRRPPTVIGESTPRILRVAATAQIGLWPDEKAAENAT